MVRLIAIGRTEGAGAAEEWCRHLDAAVRQDLAISTPSVHASRRVEHSRSSFDALCRQERNTMSSSTLIHKTKLAPADAMKVVAHFLHDMRPGAAGRIGRILGFDARQNRAALALAAALDNARHKFLGDRVRLELSTEADLSTDDESLHLAIAFPPLLHAETVSPVTPEPTVGGTKRARDADDESSTRAQRHSPRRSPRRSPGGSGTSSSTGSSTSSGGVQNA